MIGLDTNVLVRYIMQDDAKQSPKATKIIEALDGIEQSGYVTLVSIIELVWVLVVSYELTHAQVCKNRNRQPVRADAVTAKHASWRAAANAGQQVAAVVGEV